MLNDRQILELALKGGIGNFVGDKVTERDGKPCVSFGLSGHSYDVRLQPEYKVFTNITSKVLDPLNPDPDLYVEMHGDSCIIPPHGYMLGVTVEHFKLPKDVGIIVLGKSTYARLGGIVNPTMVQAGFVGPVVIEIANTTPSPLKVYAHMGIAQFVFLQGDECELDYSELAGKYMHQIGVQPAKVA